MIHFHRSLCAGLAGLGYFFILAAAGHASEGASRVNVIRVPGDAKVAKAQLGADSTIHLLVDAEDGPRYVKSTDAGVTFSAPMTIVDAASQKPGLKFHSEDLAVGKDGRVHVAMANNAWKLKLPEAEWGFYYANLPPGEIRTPGTSGMRMSLVTLSAADGATLIAWKNKHVLGWQLYDRKGQSQGAPGSASSKGNGAAGVALPTGNFILFP